MHGTHVSGLANFGNQENKILSIKLLPTAQRLRKNLNLHKGIGTTLFKLALDYLAKQQVKQLVTVTTYVNSHKADVANCSFGSSYEMMKQLIKGMYPGQLTDAELEELTVYFMNSMVTNGKAMVDAAPNTLFVIAAGNDGSNNDQYPASPASIRADNSITVAATLNRQSLAVFSNYGLTSVDVAAPGVGIKSSVPNNHYLRVSGTSQATPHVANIAAKVKDANPKLSPKEMKEIIMGTVDAKDWLKGKVKSGGVANSERAVVAADLSKNMSVTSAIAESKIRVQDINMPKSDVVIPQDAKDLVLPLPSFL
jgi:cell wall-associated protease